MNFEGDTYIQTTAVSKQEASVTFHSDGMHILKPLILKISLIYGIKAILLFFFFYFFTLFPFPFSSSFTGEIAACLVFTFLGWPEYNI